ncbi:MAG: GNAT family N-acetyltransferase [Chloroflexota bacterium]
MEFNLYPAQSEADLAFFNEEEYQSALENKILLEDRSAEEARKTYLGDLAGYLESLSNNQIIVAKSADGSYAGMIWLAERTSKELWDFSAFPAWIYDIRVRPEFRGNGLGRLLLKQAEAWAVSCGYQEIGLQVFGDNQTAINLYQSSGYLTEYSYMQLDISFENLPPLDGTLQFRPYLAEQDHSITDQLLFQQYRQRAGAKANLVVSAEEITAGFRHCLEIYNFGNQKKELIIVEHPTGEPVGVLWFYKSKGDLGRRRYIWLHAAQTADSGHLPQMLRYLEHWAADHQLDAIRTPIHQCEINLIETLSSFNYQPANLFMLKKL